MTSGIPRQKVRFEPIRVFAFETRTGRVAAEVPYVGTPRWSFGLNVAGSWSVTVKLGGDGMDKDTLSGVADPWRFSWAIAQGSKIWQAGPAISESYDDGFTTTISGAGIWKFLTDKRLLINPARTTRELIAGTDADIAFGTTSQTDEGVTIPPENQNLSLHSIARRIVEIMIAGTGYALGGNLPIVLPSSIAGISERWYPGYDLASPGQRLAELTQVIDGPEIEFRPEWVDPLTKQAVQWRMRIGNSRLGNLGFPHAWDYGKSLVKMGFQNNGTSRCNIDFERGNGMNRDLITGAYYEVPNPLDNADPLLERAGSEHTDATDGATLWAWSNAFVLANKRPVPELSATVRIAGDDGDGYATRSPELGTVDVGDNAVFRLTDHPRLPDGGYVCRIVGMEPGNDTQSAKLSLQQLGMVA